jgi:hypothetical protein
MIIILAMHFAPNVDEARARALRRWSMFKRGHDEDIKSMYFRFKCERKKVAEEAGLQIPWDLQAEKIIYMCPMPRMELLKLLEPLSYRVPATQEELDSFVQTMIQWEEMNSRHIPGNLYDNITRIFNGSPQHNMMRTYFQESRGPVSRVFTALEDGHEGAFHGHLPVRDQEGMIVDWKEQAEQLSNDWMASFPVGVNSENAFLNALIGHDEIFQESQYESRYDEPPAWTGSGSSYPDQAWYGHETSAPSFSSQAWNHSSSSHHYHQPAPTPPHPSPAYAAQSQAYSHYPHQGGYQQQVYMAQPPMLQDDLEPSSYGTDSDTSSDAGEANPNLDRISSYIAQSVGSDPRAYEQAIFQAYRNSKRLWRRHKGKHVRKFRRFVKRGVRKRKGSGKGRMYRSYPTIEQEMLTFMASKGKGKRHTSGKGFGRKGNPTGKGGKPMLCHECNSPDHLVKDCPARRAKMAQFGKGGGGFSGALLTDIQQGELDDSADFAPWEYVDPDSPGQQFDAEVTFPSGHPTADAQDASWYFMTLNPDGNDASSGLDIVQIYEGSDWQDVEVLTAVQEPQAVQPDGPLSSTALEGSQVPDRPFPVEFRNSDDDGPFCTFTTSHESGHLMCCICKLWVKTPETLSEHFKGMKHKKHHEHFVQKLAPDRLDAVAAENNALPQMSQLEKNHLTVVALIFEYVTEHYYYEGNESELYRRLLGLLTAPMRQYALSLSLCLSLSLSLSH